MDNVTQPIVFEGMPTPWGNADHCEQIIDGIGWASTPSHGGIHLSEKRNALIPHDLLLGNFAPQRRDGWYEEDCDAAIAICVFEHEILHSATQEHHTRMASGTRHWACVRQWHRPALQDLLDLSARLKDEMELLA